MDKQKYTIEKYLKFTPLEKNYIKYGSSAEFDKFVITTINILVKKDKIYYNLRLKYILNKIYKKYDNNIEIFNIFIVNIIKLLTTSIDVKFYYNHYKKSALFTKYFNYYLNDLNNIYTNLNNNHYIGIIIPI